MRINHPLPALRIAPLTALFALLIPIAVHAEYDAVHGRFLQRDPAGYIDGANLYEAFKSNPLRFLDPTGEYTINQLVGRYGEFRLKAMLLQDSRYIILHGLGKATAATGPDVIAYNKSTNVFEFFDNKAWKNPTAYKAPVWMKDLRVEQYQNILRDAIDSGVVPATLKESYKKALARAIRDGSNVRRIITPFGGNLKGIGPALLKQGIEFVDESGFKVGRSAARAAGKGLCVLPVAVALEVVTNQSTAYAEEPYNPPPEGAFIGDLQATLKRLQVGRLRYGNAERFHSADELNRTREEFIQRGYLIPRGLFGAVVAGLLDEGAVHYDWSTSLTEDDLDYINGVLRMDQRFERMEVELEVTGQGIQFGGSE